MSRSGTLALAALLFLALGSARGDQPPAPRGRVEVPETLYDAGTVDPGAKLRHEFLLKNVGTADLSVDAKPG